MIQFRDAVWKYVKRLLLEDRLNLPHRVSVWDARCELLKGLACGSPRCSATLPGHVGLLEDVRVAAVGRPWLAGMRQFVELIQAAGAILAFRWHQITTQAVPMQPAASKVARIGVLTAYLGRRRTVYGG